MLDALEITPAAAVGSSVIWLHGLGADGNDFAPLIQQWGLPDLLGTRFVLPHAPMQAVTMNGGMVSRSWYDLYDLSLRQGEDHQGMLQAQQWLLELIKRENERGVANENIVLAGFSQGGAVVLHTALRMPDPPAAVLALSTYLPHRERLADEKTASTAKLKIRIDHGDFDPVIDVKVAEHSRDLLEREGYTVDYHQYPMEHSLCEAQMKSLREWFIEILGE